MLLGYIGLGLMGKPSARHLMKAGHKLHIWARKPDKIQDLLQEGAVFCSSPADVAGKVEMLFTNLTNADDVREVLLGSNGAVSGAEPGLIVVDMSSISALATREIAKELAAKGINFVDAPVSGGTSGAEKGSLTFMVGASEEVFEKVKTVVAAMASKVTRIGDIGAGQAAKSCNQIIITGTLAAIAEAYKLAQAMNIDAEKVREALLGGLAYSKTLELGGLKMLKTDYSPGFKTNLHLKDLGIVSDLAKELEISLPVTNIGLKLLQEAVQAGHSEKDSSIIYEIVNKNR